LERKPLGGIHACRVPPQRIALLFLLERREPPEAPHIHIKGGGRDAKVWLEPEISIADSYGFNPRELSNILRVVTEHRDLILRAWHDHFAN
jgi:Domain of unknown function (DUF4160)